MGWGAARNLLCCVALAVGGVKIVGGYERYLYLAGG